MDKVVIHFLSFVEPFTRRIRNEISIFLIKDFKDELPKSI